MRFLMEEPRLFSNRAATVRERHVPSDITLLLAGRKQVL